MLIVKNEVRIVIDDDVWIKTWEAVRWMLRRRIGHHVILGGKVKYGVTAEIFKELNSYEKC